MQQVPMPLSELCDRWTIARLKLQRLPQSMANHEELQRQIEHYATGIDTTDKQLTLLTDELHAVNGKIWDEEHGIRRCIEDHLPLEEIGKKALAIRDLNMVRISVKNKIAVHTGQAEFVDVKMNYARAD